MVADDLLYSNDQKEALSRAYVHAVAAGAGYVVASWDFDRDGVDLSLSAGGAMRPSIALQLKATTRLDRSLDQGLSFQLPIKNYELLRIPTQTPRYLVVLDLPKDSSEWLFITEEQLVMKRCAYWVSLVGKPEVSNSANIKISLE